ncbi:patatin-like phospholipase family protein [Mesobacterium pallidum]|uniref:patatin-like phospholipase family protein n=1 Tax=Mesobacterium pallidum TaxID=2872037 RepID=UPI001EE358E8|nr:patatin-like phospholipase family protein [Mesobacterium pallidum]
MARKTKKKINIALQGGGAHGAFTWGVLEGLLDCDEIEICGISGASAGAVNGAALKSGFAADGRQGARAALAELWEALGAIDDAAMPAWMDLSDAVALSRRMDYLPGYQIAEAMGQMFSPYAWGPFYRHPLEPVVDKFDFGKVCHREGPHLHICATNVRTGKVRVFAGEEVTAKAILASACLPTLFKAVELPDPRTGKIEAFWDGGYTGNPALFPLFEPHLPDDIIVVNINPLVREEVPRTPQDIRNRINEISFNSSLLRELRAIGFVQRLLDDGHVADGAMKRVRVHMIADDELMNELSVATKLLPLPGVMGQLRSAGRSAAEAFLGRHLEDIGVRDSMNLSEMYG